MSLTRAEALLLTGWLASREADEITYAWPAASDERRAQAAHLYALDRQLGDDAAALLGGDISDAWQSALRWVCGGAA